MRWGFLVLIGLWLLSPVPVPAQSRPADLPNTSSSSDLSLPWLQISAHINRNDPVLQQLLPELQAYYSARNSYDRNAMRALITRHFQFWSEISGSGPDTYEQAVLAVSDYPDRSDRTFRVTRRRLSLHKLFSKSDRAVLYLDETMWMMPTRPSARQQYGDFSLDVTWHWKQTWVKTAQGWRLASVVNRNV